MSKDIKNLDLLFSENQRDIYLGLLEKKDWINRKLILNGCLDYYLDEKDRKRFFFLENLFDNVVAFHPVTYSNENLNEPKEISINAHDNTITFISISCKRLFVATAFKSLIV